MKLIRKGAEGDLFLTTWNDKEAILKSRKKKDYRNSSLDYRLRKQRTIRESQIMSEVKEFGIRTPLIHFVDIKNCDIIMQKIDGILVGDLPNTKLVNVCKKIGKLVGIMHKNGIAHGDLTTSNFIESGNNIFIIDQYIKDQVASKFVKCLEDSGVFKQDELGNKLFDKFINALVESFEK